jgi:hypothetical protein
MDHLLRDDDSNDLEWLLTVAEVPVPDSGAEIPTIVDRSSAAKRGPSLASIAFAGIHVSSSKSA